MTDLNWRIEQHRLQIIKERVKEFSIHPASRPLRMRPMFKTWNQLAFLDYIPWLLQRVEELEKQVEIEGRLSEEILSLLGALVDNEPCEYDHHDYCQSHGLEPRPCPHERAKNILRRGPNAFSEDKF